MSQRLLDQLQSYDKNITDLIQHSYNPVSHETIKFFAFSRKELKYIVSTYRRDSNMLISSENRVMQNIIKNTKNEISKSILFSLETLKTDSFIFRVQAYVSKSKTYVRKMQKFNNEDIHEILKESNDWIISFQERKSEKRESYDDELSGEIRHWISEHQEDVKRAEFLELMLKLLQFKTTKISKKPSHGDYCYWNYFKGTDNKFYVFDWEFAKESDWDFIDPLTNVFVFWMDLYKQFKVGALSAVLTSPSTHLEEIVNREFERIMRLYEISKHDLYLFILFVYCRLYLRQETFSKELPLFEELSNFLAFTNKNIKKDV